MILLDTNVVSELMRPAPEPTVPAWTASHPTDELSLSAVGEAELRYGAAIPAAGRRRDTLVLHIEAMLENAFEERILPFDSNAARHYADMAAARRAAGRPVAQADCQTEATIRHRGLTVATRNIATSANVVMDLVDPWVAE